MKYQESQEMYLETILTLKAKISHVRSIDIANELNFSRPSVSRAVKLMQQNGYILVAANGEITFTELGEKLAKDIFERHLVITKLLMNLGASEELAQENACRIEHVISQELMDIIKKNI